MSAYTALAAVEKELKEAREKLTKYTNIRSAVTSLPGYLDSCVNEHKTASAFTSDIIISKESIDAGAMGEIDDDFKKMQEDFEEMIDQGNRLIAKYKEKVAELEAERARLIAEIEAVEAAARQAAEYNNISQSTK